MNTTRDIPRVGDPAGVAQPDLDAQIHRLPPRIAHIARVLGLGKIHQSGSWRYSLREAEAARAESKRRTTAKKRPRQSSGFNILPPNALSGADVILSPDRLDRVEQILFRSALMATELGATLHQAAQLVKARRLEWEAQLLRDARQERGS